MGALADRFIKSRRHLVMNEKEVITVLRVLNDVLPISDYEYHIGNCGWDDTNKWFIHFSATNRRWYRIMKDLNVKIVDSVLQIPVDNNDKIYMAIE